MVRRQSKWCTEDFSMPRIRYWQGLITSWHDCHLRWLPAKRYDDMQRHGLKLTLVGASRALESSHCASTKNLQCLSASKGLIPLDNDHFASAVDWPYALPDRASTPIFALCSKHCKRNNRNNERNAFVDPSWVEHDLNTHIKPYRHYRSAFLASAVTPSASEHPIPTTVEHPTPEIRQSQSLAVPQEVDINNTAPASNRRPRLIKLPHLPLEKMMCRRTPDLLPQANDASRGPKRAEVQLSGYRVPAHASVSQGQCTPTSDKDSYAHCSCCKNHSFLMERTKSKCRPRRVRQQNLDNTFEMKASR